VFLYYTPEQDYYVVHRPDRFHDNSRRRRRRRRRENRRAKVDLDSPLLSPPLHQPPSTKKKQRQKKRERITRLARWKKEHTLATVLFLN
jgi:hypothetical protein